MSKVLKSEKTRHFKTGKELSKQEKAAVVEKLTTARVGLLLRHPFFGNLATRMKLIEASDWCPTLATDGRNFYYNSEFVHNLSIKETEFGFGHEILHNVFDHLDRRGNRNAELSNIAADFAVNQILKDENIGVPPSFIKIFQDNKYRGWSYEKIYDDLEQRAKKIKIQDLGELLDEHLDSDESGGGQDGDNDGNKSKRPRLSKEERQAIRDEMREAVLAAAQSAGAGKVPASIARMIKDFTEPKMNWKEILRLNLQSLMKSNYSFTRPNRKSQMCGAILPGMVNQETIDISVALDMSGSISNKQVQDFLSEVKGIMDQFEEFKIDVFCFDTKVYNYASFTADTASDITSYEPKGGGGTDFECIWDFLKEQESVPKKLLVFTDMYPCGSWGDENYCDTIFVAHGTTSITAPFGQTIFYSED
jgi:predicted metal-dependent peptidase